MGAPNLVKPYQKLVYAVKRLHVAMRASMHPKHAETCTCTYARAYAQTETFTEISFHAYADSQTYVCMRMCAQTNRHVNIYPSQ